MPAPRHPIRRDTAGRASRSALALCATLLLSLLTGCSWEWAHRIYPLPFYESGVTVGGETDRLLSSNGKIAVLPFNFDQGANAEREEAVATLRTSFDTGLRTLRSYNLVPLDDVDERLSEAGVTREAIPEMNPAALGRITGADMLLYGDVKRTRNMTLYLYSHTVYEGTFRLVEAKTGDVLWSGRLWEGVRGGMLVNLFVADIWMEEPKNKELPEAYRRTADVAVRKLVETIPEPLEDAGWAEGDGESVATGPAADEAGDVR